MSTRKITITVEDLKVGVELNNSKTAEKIWEALLIEANI